MIGVGGLNLTPGSTRLVFVMRPRTAMMKPATCQWLGRQAASLIKAVSDGMPECGAFRCRQCPKYSVDATARLLPKRRHGHQFHFGLLCVAERMAHSTLL